MPFAIGDGSEIAVVVVGIPFDLQEGVFAAGRPVHIVGRVHRLLTLRIGDGEQIAVGIVAELRHPVDGIGELADAIERIGSIDRLLPQRIDHAPQSSRGIQHALGLPIQGIFDRDEIPQFVGEGRLVIQRIFDRDRLPLCVHIDRRDLAERIGDGLEIALGVIPECGRVAQGIGRDGECKIKQ